MRKLLSIVVISMLGICPSYAGDGDKYLNLYGGWQGNVIKWNSDVVNVLIGYEMETSYHNAFELFFDYTNELGSRSIKNKKTSPYMGESYKTIGFGLVYKPMIMRNKNSILRWRFGGALGANNDGFEAAVDLGLEYSITFRNQMQFFVLQKNDFVFFSKNNFRNGLLIGIKFPLTR